MSKKYIVFEKKYLNYYYIMANTGNKNKKFGSKKPTKKKSKKMVTFSKKGTRKRTFKKQLYKKNKQSMLDSKNNNELSTYNLTIARKNKIPSYAFKLVKDQPIQTFKWIEQHHHETVASSQSFNFINLLRADRLEQLFSYVPTPYQYIQTDNGVNNPILIDQNNNKQFLFYGQKLLIQDLTCHLKIKSSCNTSQFVKIYVIKPRTDMSYFAMQYIASGNNQQRSKYTYSIDDIYTWGVQDNRNIAVVPGSQSSIDPTYVGVTPYNSIYLTKKFKILSKYTREIRLSDGGNIDVNINIPINKILDYERLTNDYINDNQNVVQFNKWVKGMSYAILVQYYGDQGINTVNGTNPKMVTMPCSNLQLVDCKLDFKICNNIKSKLTQYGYLNPTAGQGVNQTVDEQGNQVQYNTLNSSLPPNAPVNV